MVTYVAAGNGDEAMKDQTFFKWQERVLGGLMVWGAANVVIGAGGSRVRDDVPRQFAWQALTWGAIDLVLALLGRRGARTRGQTATPATTQRAVARFRRVLAINAGLDVAYILGGSVLAATARHDRRRKGVGLGILVQGIFLAVYDALLLQHVDQWNARQ
jgi:hypothetical protein